jgi:uncharacterized membrane protein YoaK (UPF0700 family)
MFSKPTPLWIVLGGFGLACMAGGINAVGFLGMHHQAISHMSGTVTVLSNELATGRFSLALYAVAVVVSFFIGSVLSAAIIRDSALKLGRRYGMVLAIESALLFAACRMLMTGNYAGDCLAAMACGLQNAMATHYSCERRREHRLFLAVTKSPVVKADDRPRQGPIIRPGQLAGSSARRSFMR